MLTRFRVHNYKSLLDFEVPLSDPVTILASANGVGKTSVCQAMDLALALTERRPGELLQEENDTPVSNKWTGPPTAAPSSTSSGYSPTSRESERGVWALAGLNSRSSGR